LREAGRAARSTRVARRAAGATALAGRVRKPVRGARTRSDRGGVGGERDCARPGGAGRLSGGRAAPAPPAVFLT
jgi:hypothetical protein